MKAARGETFADKTIRYFHCFSPGVAEDQPFFGVSPEEHVNKAIEPASAGYHINLVVYIRVLCAILYKGDIFRLFKIPLG